MTKTEQINDLINKYHHLINDYHNGWLSYKQYKIQVETIKNELKRIKEGK